MPHLEQPGQGKINFDESSRENHFLVKYTDKQRVALNIEVLRKFREHIPLTEEEKRFVKWQELYNDDK